MHVCVHVCMCVCVCVCVCVCNGKSAIYGIVLNAQKFPRQEIAFSVKVKRTFVTGPARIMYVSSNYINPYFY